MCNIYITTTLACIVSKVKGKLISLVVEPHHDKKGSITLYDGVSTNDTKLATFRTATGETTLFTWLEPLPFEKGLFIGNFSDCDNVLIQFDIDVG